MVGGMKRKISIEKIEKKDPRAVAFSKRRKGLYNKAAELCHLSDAQIAIIATPVSSNSNVSFYTFGHSSVDSVVDAFLAGQRPLQDDERLGFWWEDERLAKSENPEELRDAIDAMSTMLQDLKELLKRRDREDVEKKKEGVSDITHQKQTLNPEPCSAMICIQDDIAMNFEGFHKNTEEQVVAVSDNSDNNGLLGTFDGCNQDQEFDLDHILYSLTNSDVLPMNLGMDEDQMLAISYDNNNTNNDALLN